MRSCRNGKAQLPCFGYPSEGTEPVTQSNWLVACYLRGLMFDGAVFQGNSWSRPTGMVSRQQGRPSVGICSMYSFISFRRGGRLS